MLRFVEAQLQHNVIFNAVKHAAFFHFLQSDKGVAGYIFAFELKEKCADNLAFSQWRF